MDYPGLRHGRNTPLAYNDGHEDDRLSTASSTAKSSAVSTRRVKSSSLPNLKRPYIPSLYHNQDNQLSRKVKEFLKKPPLNSQEYFDMLCLRRQSEPLREEAGSRMIKSAPTSPDELSKKFWHLLPERRTIQSMILPPIRDGCVVNYHNKPSPKRTAAPFVDPSVNLMDQLKYCRYIRPRPVRHKAWEDRSQDNKAQLL